MQILRALSQLAIAELEQKTRLNFFRRDLADKGRGRNHVANVDLCDVWFGHEIDVDFAQMASLPASCYCRWLLISIISGVHDFFSGKAWWQLFRWVFLNDKTIQLFASFFWNRLVNAAVLILLKGVLLRSISISFRAQRFWLIWDTCVDGKRLRLRVVLSVGVWCWRVCRIKLLLVRLVAPKFGAGITQFIFFDQNKLLVA